MPGSRLVHIGIDVIMTLIAYENPILAVQIP